jgi:protein-S-isoprenylcysteine O-methyltransferase Ste14
VINHLLGFFSSWIVYSVILVLHLVVPARSREGYVVDSSTGSPYQYRINGLPVMVIAVVIWVALGSYRVVPFEWLYLHRWSGLAGAITLGLASSAWLVAGARPVRRNVLADFFLGRRFSPQYLGGRVDAKMFLYLVGATMLALNILSFASYHFTTYGRSLPVTLYTALFFWFLVDYMTFEHVHLYTYDLVAERVGFKLVFGCLAFYPYFYLVGLWAVADREPADVSLVFLVVSALVFFVGWALARGANMQKYVFKRDPQKPFLGIIEPEVISDGNRRVLCSGFWGLSRHINYLGEVLMASGLTLALGYPGVLVAWLYPLYYVVLLGTRQADDDRRCRLKYGELWQEYEDRVPSRIIPGIY